LFAAEWELRAFIGRLLPVARSEPTSEELTDECGEPLTFGGRE
jgi:hypothetical protein